MANNELAIRFTENNYATRNEVSKELKMSLIDNIWSNILSYRSYFNHYLTIKDIEKNPYVVCVCSSVMSNINGIDSKLIKLTRDYMRLNPNSGDLAHFEDKCFSIALKEVAKANDIAIDDMYLRSVLHGELKNPAPTHMIVINYARALQFIKTKAASPIDVDYLAELYSIITGNDNLTSFYRTLEDKDHSNKVLIDRVYTAAPVAKIEEMMNSLFSFIQSSNLSAAVKAIVTYYYVSFIKPFPRYSDEIAVLLAKSVLAHFDLSDFGASLPMEQLLTEDVANVAKIFVEVQKTKDVTYFVNYGIKFLEKRCEELSDILANREAYALKQDFYKEDEPIETSKEEPAIEETSYVEPVKEVKVDETQTIPQKEIAMRIVEPTPKPVEVQQKVEVEKVEPKPTPVVREVPIQKEEIAVAYIPPVLDERSACRLEEHLLELDPSMKRGEAHFYARHCTLGKRYTIQQYKRSIGCAYETARTSMDHLVAMGYYRKEMVKNKNVYTPIPRD